MKPVIILALTGAVLAAPATGAQQLDASHNETPITMAANPQAIAKIPAGFHFVHPGYLTVATSANNSPPIGLWASDNKTLIGSDRIARLLADSLGLKLRLVPAAGGLAAGHHGRAL